MTVGNSTGDGIHSTLIETNVFLPDSGTEVKVDGAVQEVGLPRISINDAKITIPAHPGSGSVFYIVEVNPTTAEIKVAESTEASPVAKEGWVQIFSQTLTSSGTSDPALAGDQTPDSTTPI